MRAALPINLVMVVDIFECSEKKLPSALHNVPTVYCDDITKIG